MGLRPVFACAIVLAASSTLAQTPLTIEDVFRPAAYAEPMLSDNGKHFAVTIPANDRRNLAIVDMETREAVRLTDFKDFDVIEVQWVCNDRLLFTLGQARSPTGPGQFNGGGLFMVSRDGKESRRLWDTVGDYRAKNQRYRRLDVFRILPGDCEEVIAVGNLRDEDSNDLYRLNIRTGRTTLITTTRPTRASGWVLDNNFVPRVVTSWVKDTNTFIVSYRRNEDAEWVELARYDETKGPTFVPLGFEADNKTLLVAFNGGRDTMAIYRYEPETKKLGDVVAEHPRFDMGANAEGGRTGGVLRDWKTQRIVGYAVNAEKPQRVYIDEAYLRLQRMIDGALPDTVNYFSRTPEGKQLVVTAFSDRDPTKWYLLDEEKKTMEELFVSRPWIKSDQLVEMKPFYFKSRDGLDLLGYTFLPKKRKPGERLPTIVHIHGGPSVRADSWGSGFGWFEGQLFASRGYAVIVPGFRITPGFGGKIFYAGFGAFGRQMLEDHEDAAKWAVKEGIADPDRICMSGASYGGYATLMSLARFPQTFKCGVAGLVVSDVEMLLTSPAGDIPYSKAAVAFWTSMVGVSKPSEIPPEVSPANLADKIKQPLLIYAGGDDIRTPMEQTRKMIRALERAGNPPKAVIIKAGEGHGYGKTQNNVELYNKIFEFLEASIGPKAAQ
jgi:dipeptidyl aminopeptidase/acylaminoacyl peptidase